MVENGLYADAIIELEGLLDEVLTDPYEIAQVEGMIVDLNSLIGLESVIDEMENTQYSIARTSLDAISFTEQSYKGIANSVSAKIYELIGLIADGLLEDNHLKHLTIDSITSTRTEDIDAPDITFDPSLPTQLDIGQS